MKVSVIGYNPKEGPYSYGSVSVWCANGWRENGHEVEMFDRSEMDRLPKKCDLYFFVDVSEDYSKSMPDDLDGVKIFWAMDTAMPGGLERTVNISKKMDYVFTTNYETYGPKALEKFGIEAMWVPYGYDRKLRQEVMHDSRMLDTDVFMCGNPNSPERVELWKLLNERYSAITGTIDNKTDYVQSKGRSKIVINQPTAGHNTIINLRVWNATACGKLLLCKRTVIKEMELLGFKDGVNVVYWDEFKDLFEKIDYYLEHDDERRKIASEGAKIGDKHLMVDQVRVIEQILYNKFYDRLI